MPHTTWARAVGVALGRQIIRMSLPDSFTWQGLLLQAVIGKIIAYTSEAMANGSFWWWVLPLAPGVPETLIVGREREFLNWFYQGPSGATREAIPPESVDEYLRTFSGKEGVLGADGVYRAAFTSIAQTSHCRTAKSRFRLWQ